jgi:hypothetical protein
MNKINSGLQYHVYDLGNGRVLKKETSRFFKVFNLIGFVPLLIFNPVRIYSDIKNTENITKLCYDKIKKSNVDLSKLGNPTF